MGPAAGADVADRAADDGVQRSEGGAGPAGRRQPVSRGGRGLFRMPNRQAAIIGWKAAQSRQAAGGGRKKPSRVARDDAWMAAAVRARAVQEKQDQPAGSSRGLRDNERECPDE